ncbi:MAG: ribbon-helix-helix domain-containing protein [Candidatus Nitrosoglobus sp.]
MKKRTSLDSVFGKGPEPETSLPESKEKRPHVVQQTAYLPPEVYEQLRRLAFDERRKMHSYLIEGLERVFADRGLPSIKELKGKS